ncbi:hypothetical protein D3C80_1495280 [compost metagenome]
MQHSAPLHYQQRPFTRMNLAMFNPGLLSAGVGPLDLIAQRRLLVRGQEQQYGDSVGIVMQPQGATTRRVGLDVHV